MNENYRELPEWQALNRIWKAVPAASRAGVKDDFRIITELIKGGAAVKAEPKPEASARAEEKGGGAATNFLSGLSADARRLALGLLTKEGFNLYDYLTELAVTSRAGDAEELFDAYVSQRDIDDGQEDALMEIIGACLSRTRV